MECRPIVASGTGPIFAIFLASSDKGHIGGPLSICSNSTGLARASQAQRESPRPGLVRIMMPRQRDDDSRTFWNFRDQPRQTIEDSTHLPIPLTARAGHHTIMYRSYRRYIA